MRAQRWTADLATVGSAAARAARSVKRRFGPRAWWHALHPGRRKIVKLSGIGNDERETRYYASLYHFTHSIPSIVSHASFDCLVCQNYLHQEFVAFDGPKVFFSREPAAGMTAETLENMCREELQPYLYRYDDPHVERRCFYVALPDDRRAVVWRLRQGLHARRAHPCCIINRYVENPALDLCAQRVRFVRALMPNIDIYGYRPYRGANKWEDFSTYRGPAADKVRTLSRYTFALTFENSDLPGYITEKILHTLLAGTVPLYWGGGHLLDQTIPPACFIDCRDQDPIEIRQRIETMTHEQIVAYRRAAIAFLASSRADRFTQRYWARAIAARLMAQQPSIR